MSAASNESEKRAGEAPLSTDEEVVLDRVAAALRGLKYGTVTIVVHDGYVVQIDRTERTRLR